MLQSVTALALDAFVPPLAPVVLLLFLGAGFVIFCCAVAAAIAAAARRSGLARILGAGALVVGVGYGVLLLVASLLSRELTLAAGERKYFCEMDCHLAYSVEAASSPEASVRVVTLKTWFDPSTIASFRGNGPLTPNPRELYLVDDARHRYLPSPEATRAWAAKNGGSTPLNRELRPGESYTSTFVFAVPPSARNLRLFLGDPLGPENLIVNHENSPFHARTYFGLPEEAEPTSAAERRS